MGAANVILKKMYQGIEYCMGKSDAIIARRDDGHFLRCSEKCRGCGG